MNTDNHHIRSKHIHSNFFFFFSWSGSMLGQLMAVLLQADKYEKACIILSKLDREQQKILGVPDIRPLKMFVDKSVERKDVNNAIVSIDFYY